MAPPPRVPALRTRTTGHYGAAMASHGFYLPWANTLSRRVMRAGTEATGEMSWSSHRGVFSDTLSRGTEGLLHAARVGVHGCSSWRHHCRPLYPDPEPRPIQSRTDPDPSDRPRWSEAERSGLAGPCRLDGRCAAAPAASILDPMVATTRLCLRTAKSDLRRGSSNFRLCTLSLMGSRKYRTLPHKCIDEGYSVHAASRAFFRN